MDTPQVVIGESRLNRNIEDMSKLARRAGVALRPHVKTHKLPEIARRQLAAGAVGITVAKLGEAEVMAAYGVADIFIANQIVGAEKMARLFALAQRVNLAAGVDSQAGVRMLAEAAEQFGLGPQRPFEILIEVDSGLRRCGVEPGSALVALAEAAAGFPSLHLRGIFTHAGHAYGAQNKEELDSIGRYEGEIMAGSANILRQAGIPIEVVSVGSTPTVGISALVPGVTEIRPGNYVFFDAVQLALGVIPDADYCALRVLSTVISHPASNRWVIDAGSKTLSLDKGAHGSSGVPGHGLVVGHPDLQIVRLSEEHGIIEGEDASLAIGDVVEIIPNHACTVVNLFDELIVNGEVPQVWPVAGRGKNK